MDGRRLCGYKGGVAAGDEDGGAVLRVACVLKGESVEWMVLNEALRGGVSWTMTTKLSNRVNVDRAQ